MSARRSDYRRKLGSRRRWWHQIRYFTRCSSCNGWLRHTVACSLWQSIQRGIIAERAPLSLSENEPQEER